MTSICDFHHHWSVSSLLQVTTPLLLHFPWAGPPNKKQKVHESTIVLIDLRRRRNRSRKQKQKKAKRIEKRIYCEIWSRLRNLQVARIWEYLAGKHIPHQNVHRILENPKSRLGTLLHFFFAFSRPICAHVFVFTLSLWFLALIFFNSHKPNKFWFIRFLHSLFSRLMSLCS